jgi:hypothetical protein
VAKIICLNRAETVIKDMKSLQKITASHLAERRFSIGLDKPGRLQKRRSIPTTILQRPISSACADSWAWFDAGWPSDSADLHEPA